MSSAQPVIPGPVQRGRARSHSMHEDTHSELLSDLDVLNGIASDPASSAAAGAAGEAGDASQRAAASAAGVAGAPPQPKPKPALSKKTMTMLSDLSAAVKTTPPELELTTEHELTEEELAEKELAEQERQRRTNDAAGSAAAGGGGPLASGSGAGGAGTASGTSGTSALFTSAAAPKRPGRRKGDDPEFDILIKLLLLGDAGVGKTSLMLRYSDDKFSTSLLSTAGVDYKAQFLEIDGKTVKCQIWDTAGQQRFHVITQAYYKGAHGIVLVYDVSDESSFLNVRYWMENITKHANPHCVRILVANKIDSRNRKVDSARGRTLAEEFKMAYFETSAKDGTGVREAFHTAARDAVLKAHLAADAGSGASAGSAKSVKQLKGDKKEGKDCAIQ